MATFAHALREATRDLAAAGIPNADVDARLLLCAAAGVDRLTLIRDPDRPISAEVAMRFEATWRRRAAREPVSRILATRAFWSLDIRITPDVLDPRADTETLVDAVLDVVTERRSAPLRVLDLGTGSGAILCALLHELPAARGWAVDRSAPACIVARDNLAVCGLAARSLVVQGNWAEALPAAAFDIVVSNPPYVETEAIAGLDRDVREHDPWPALDGGADGLAAYRILAADLPRLLVPGGLAALEVGRGQDAAVSTLMMGAGLSSCATRLDLAGIARVVVGWR